MRSLLLTLALLGLTTACKQEAPKPVVAGGPLRVCVSIPPLIGVVKAIAGEEVEVTSLMSAQDDPHTFSPTPQSIANLRDAQLFLTIGVDYEKAVCDKVGPMFPNLKVVNVGAAVKHLTMGEHHHHEAEGTEHGDQDEHQDPVSDPHVWLSLPNLIVIGDQVRAALGEVAPAQAEEFAARYAEYRNQLEAKSADFATRLADLKSRSFCVYHPVFGYFARDYGLTQAVVEVDGKEPSPQQLRTLLDEAKEESFTVVFVQPQFNDRAAKTIADMIGGRVVRVNPLAEDTVALLETAVGTLVGDRK